jgi:hypothetical protein
LSILVMKSSSLIFNSALAVWTGLISLAMSSAIVVKYLLKVLAIERGSVMSLLS